MTYKFVNCYDVSQALGIKGAQSFMKEDIARQLKNLRARRLRLIAPIYLLRRSL